MRIITYFILLKSLILDATNRHPVGSVEGDHVGSAASEVQGLGVYATYRTGPIEAEDAHIVDPTIAAVVAAGHR